MYQNFFFRKDSFFFFLIQVVKSWLPSLYAASPRLTMVKKHEKAAYFAKLIELIQTTPKILIIGVDFVGSKQMQEIRSELRGKATILMGHPRSSYLLLFFQEEWWIIIILFPWRLMILL